jgi:hypothetical protein
MVSLSTTCSLSLLPFQYPHIRYLYESDVSLCSASWQGSAGEGGVESIRKDNPSSEKINTYLLLREWRFGPYVNVPIVSRQASQAPSYLKSNQPTAPKQNPTVLSLLAVSHKSTLHVRNVDNQSSQPPPPAPPTHSATPHTLTFSIHCGCCIRGRIRLVRIRCVTHSTDSVLQLAVSLCSADLLGELGPACETAPLSC